LSESNSRILFALTVLWGASIVWLAPHPPMLDLPQHAGQLALLKQLLAGESPWGHLFQVNFFTPYMLGFALALPLSFVLPVAAALKALLSLAFVAFVFVCVALRRHFGADARLDWLFLTSFFGFAFKWGFFTFVLAVPFGLWFILLADRYAIDRSGKRGLALAAAGVVLLASHGLVFLFSCIVATALLTARSRDLLGWLRALWPLVFLGLVCVAYFFARDHAEAGFQVTPTVPSIMWQVGIRHEILYYAFGKQWTPLYTLVGIFFLAVPWLLGLRIDIAKPARLVPFAVAAIVLTFVPSFMFETSFVYQRFAIFLFPTYAWMFTAAVSRESASPRVRAGVMLLLAVACWSVLALNSVRTWKFGHEAADFDRVVAGLEPQQRALALIFDRSSQADADPVMYVHYASWYQAEKQGLVDFNFAWVPPQIVRYRVAARPPVIMSFSWRPQDFDWARHQGDTYRYFLVRHREALPANLFKGAACAPVLVQQSGPWKVFERGACESRAGS
jgi:hypothetical protein